MKEFSYPFNYCRKVNFYETDLMGVVHHANYLKFYEEARVEWLRARDIKQYHGKDAGCLFAVLDTQVKHLRPAYFEDDIEILLQVKLEGIRITFEYKMYSKTSTKVSECISYARTCHVPVDENLKVVRLPKPIIEVIKRELWTETWL